MSGPGSNVDLVLADGLQSTQYVQGLTVPAIAELHDSMSMLLGRQAEMKQGLERLRFRLEGWGMARWERALGGRFSRVMTNSDVDARHIDRLDPGCPVLSISNGVDTDYFSPPEDSAIERHRLVFTGVMSYGPNADAARYFCDEILPRSARNGAGGRVLGGGTRAARGGARARRADRGRPCHRHRR